MKVNKTIYIDLEVILEAEKHCKEANTKLSKLIEELLREKLKIK